MQREIGGYRIIAHEESQQGHPYEAQAHQCPKQEKQQIDQQKGGESQSDTRQDGMIHRMEPAGIAHQQHHNDRCDIRTDHQICKKLIDFSHGMRSNGCYRRASASLPSSDCRSPTYGSYPRYGLPPPGSPAADGYTPSLSGAHHRLSHYG